MPKKSEFGKKPRKKLMVLMYIANKPTHLARWKDLVDYGFRAFSRIVYHNSMCTSPNIECI